MRYSLFVAVAFSMFVTPHVGYAFELLRTLARGSEGSDVRVVQEELVTQGFLQVTPNGYFGPATETAVRAFQKAKGISALGMVGPRTADALFDTQKLSVATAQSRADATAPETVVVPRVQDVLSAEQRILSLEEKVRLLSAISFNGATVKNATLQNVRFDGSSGLTDADIPDAITIDGDQTLESLTVSDWIDVRDAKLMVPRTTTPSADCTAGELVLDTDATSGSRLFVCESDDTWALQGPAGSGDNQTIDVFSFTGDTLSLSLQDDGETTKTVDLSSYAKDADFSTWTGSTALTTLGTIATGAWQGTAIADAYLIKTGNWTGTFDGYEASALLDNTDAQTLSLASNTLSISGGNSIDLSAYLDDTNTTYTAGTGLSLAGTQFSLGFSTSLGLRGVISDETGTGALVFADSPAFTTGATINGYRVGVTEGITETSTMLTQVAQATITGTGIIDFTTAGLRDYASAPMAIVTPVFDASGIDQLSCTPHTITATGMVIDCV